MKVNKMKKLLIGTILLSACSSAVPATVAAPTTPVVENKVEENPYTGVVSALGLFLDMNYSQFEAVCQELDGGFYFSESVATCLDSGGAGFALRFEPGRTLGAAVIVPLSHGKQLAEAAIEQVGAPDYSEGNTATWELGELVLVFTPNMTNSHYFLILERTD